MKREGLVGIMPSNGKCVINLHVNKINSDSSEQNLSNDLIQTYEIVTTSTKRINMQPKK